MARFVTPSQLKELKSLLTCDLCVKGESPLPEYRAAIQRYNTVFVKRAQVIIFVRDEQDVATAIQFLTKHHIDFAVAGGRHSYQGASSSDAVVIGDDLKELNHVVIDKDRMLLTAGGGCRAEDVEVPCEQQDLRIVTGLISETGIGGFTLGGGTGLLTGQHGTGSDNLLSARVVLANGQVVTASEEENADLFWALRGCGPNFGICVEMQFRVHKSRGPVYFGWVTMPPEKLQACLELALNISREQVDEHHGRYLPMLNVNLAPTLHPSDTVTLIPSFVVFYDGPESEGRKIAQPIFDLGPVNDSTAQRRYTEVTQYWKQLPNMHDHPIATSATHIPATSNVEVLNLLGDGFKDIVRKHSTELGASSFGLELRSQASHALTSFPDTAYALRQNGILANLNFIHKNVKMNKVIRADAQALMGRIRAALVDGSSLDDADGVVTLANLAAPGEKIEKLWGSKFSRLQELKRKYDPDFVFNKWFPIPPG